MGVTKTGHYYISPRKQLTQVSLYNMSECMNARGVMPDDFEMFGISEELGFLLEEPLVSSIGCIHCVFCKAHKICYQCLVKIFLQICNIRIFFSFFLHNLLQLHFTARVSCIGMC